MQAPDYARAILELRPYENSTGERTRATAKQLIKYLVSGKHTFTVGDFERDMKLSRKQAENAVTHFRASGMIETCGRVGKSHCCYRVKTDFPPFIPADYSPEILETVKELQESAESEKDKRIARVLISCLPKGAISTADYDNGIHKLAEDMRLLESLHIVEKYRPGFYLINRQASAAPITLSTEQKAILSQLYERFRTGRFTRKEAIVELNRSKTSLSTQLRLFSQMKIVRRTNEYGITYQLLVTPDDHPELFESIASQAPDEPGTISYDGYSYKTRDMIERLAGSKSFPRDKRLGTSLQRCLKKGTLTRSDYDAWGYSKWMWNSDVTLALQIGLIREIADGAYALNQNPVEHIPELMPAQKKTVTEIYEAFGDKTFSVEMFVATLNHTESYTYASLHHLMLLRILDYKKTADGSVYQLAVNPEDHPECFYTAA